MEEFYRYFEIPGLQHCSGGVGGQPSGAFEVLKKWVENGSTPETLPVTFTDGNGQAFDKFICRYPQKTVWDEIGDPNNPDSFYCE